MDLLKKIKIDLCELPYKYSVHSRIKFHYRYLGLQQELLTIEYDFYHEQYNKTEMHKKLRKLNVDVYWLLHDLEYSELRYLCTLFY
jgi:hypothetical protein